MKNIFAFFNQHRKNINLTSSTLILFIGCLFIMAGSVIVNPRYMKVFASFLIQSPLLIIVNLIPIIIILLLLFFLSNNPVFSVIAGGSLFALMGIINTEKIRLRQDPLYPTDVNLIGELFGIAKGFTPKLILLYVLMVLFLLALIFISLKFFKAEPLRKRVRFGAVILIVLTALGLNATLYSSEYLYENFPVEGNRFFEVNHYASKGYIYCFIYKYNAMKVNAPREYSAGQMRQFEQNYTQELTYDNDVFPHIIMIMGEAYSDLSDNRNLDYTDYADPMANWKAIAAGGQAVSGHIIVPNYGGGTSDTEFDALTALPTRFINSASNSYSLIRRPIDAMPSRLKTLGYDTLAIHPGYSWFYNRYNVFQYMGFDDFIHLESFQGSEKYSGGYIADKYATDMIIETFEEHIAVSDNPLFQFTVTIQNHGPYDEKYNEVKDTFDTDVYMTEKEKTLLNSYFMGILDADREIGRMIDYFEASDEPVVFIYFGDHLPGFSNSMAFFDILDYDISVFGTQDQLYGVYRTPFMIWQNSASKSLFDIQENGEKANFPDDMIISSNYLGSTALELMGMNGVSPVMDLSNKLRKEIPILDDKTYKLINGNYTEELEPELMQEVTLMRHLTYYKLFDE